MLPLQLHLRLPSIAPSLLLKVFFKYLLAVAICCSHARSIAQTTDTLPGVEVFGHRAANPMKSATSVHTLDKEGLQRVNSVSVADAVKYFPGVVVKDYGGIGGLKTVSVRSLGANHTGFSYDGIVVRDAQGGQLDLGRFSVDNLESVALFNEQPTDILLPARSYASASMIAVATSAQSLQSANKQTLSLRLKAGSFGTWSPSFFYKRKLAQRWFVALNAEYLQSQGNYPFKAYEDSGNNVRRINSDIASARAELDLAYLKKDSSEFRFKTYMYASKRGLPGGVVLYNSFSNQRLNSNNVFSQFAWKKSLSTRSRLLIAGKYSLDHKYYLDPSFQTSAGKLENRFIQQEIYASAAYRYSISRTLSFALSSDYFFTKLERTDGFATGFAQPTRDNYLGNAALQWKTPRFEANANALFTANKSKVKAGPEPKSMWALTPAFSVSVQPLVRVPLRVRASFKRIFRVPSFDDLYYTNVGNTALRPEYATLYNLGVTFTAPSTSGISLITLTADVYYNKVKDKILAVPRQNLFQWSMLNIGRSDARGLDLGLQIGLPMLKEIEPGINISYGYQRSQDLSDPSSRLYKTQLPYVPEHTATASIHATVKSFSFAYNILASSYRYRPGEAIPENLLPGWATHDVNITYTLKRMAAEYRLVLEANNIYNKQYEIIRYYPMPRFGYKIGLLATFKK